MADSTSSRVSFTLDSSLDSVNKVEQTAEEHAARAGLVVVLVEHDMSLVMSISDEIVVLDAGRRIAAGTPWPPGPSFVRRAITGQIFRSSTIDFTSSASESIFSGGMPA